jgi:hypothetical protein
VSVLALDRFRRRIIDNDKLLMKQYGLDKSERVTMVIMGLVLMQFAVPIGSSIYFILFQTRLAWSYPKQNMSLGTVYLTDYWDRLPIYIEHLFGAHWFASEEAPTWWVTARHDFRHVLIGFVASLLVGAITVGLKKRKRASVTYMVFSVPLGFILAMSVAAVLIVFFEWAAPFMDQIGSSSGNPFVNDLIGKGTIQLTVIGFAAGFVAKKLVLIRTFATIQTMSIERWLADGVTVEKGWWRYVYPPNYRKRFRYLVACNHEPQSPARWLGLVLSFCAPVLLFLLVFGYWLLYFGPAAHAH